MPEAAVFSLVHQSLTRVHRGRVSFDVEPLAPGSTFGVRANDVLVEVVGTSFSVEVVSADETRVQVTHGTVRVSRNGEVTYVHAGESWPTEAVGHRGLRRPDAETNANTEAAVDPQDAQPLDRNGAATSADSFGAQKGTPGGEGAVPSADADRNDDPDGPTAALQQAAGLIEVGDFDGARRIYEGLAEQSGPSGELGLYMLATLELRHLSAPDEAEATLAEMGQRYPRGTLALERSVTVIEVAVSLGRCEDGEHALDELRSRFPSSAALISEATAMLAAAGCAR
jgi:TolA-binding protein